MSLPLLPSAAEPATIMVAVASAFAYGRGILRGATRYARLRGSIVVVPMDSTSLANIARWSPRFGFIVQSDNPRIAAELAALHAAAVNVADNVADVPLPTIISDHRAIGALAADHFLARGFRRVAFFGPTDWYSRLRCEGFQNRLSQCHPPITAPWIVDRNELRHWLGQQQPPTAVFAAHDSAALDVLGICRSVALAVPEQVAVMGVDNDELLSEAGGIPLSSVAVHALRIGFEAARAVDRLLAGKPLTIPQPLLIPPLGVITRKSTDVTAIEDQMVARAVSWLEAHLRQRITVEDLLEQLPVSRRCLEKHFRHCLARSPAGELRRLRVERAKQLLDSTDLSLARIAEEAGLASDAVLCQIFTRVMGLSPGRDRQRGRLPE